MKLALDIYDDFPKDMKRYLQHNGWHFNKKSCDFAVSLMKRMQNGKKVASEHWSKDKVEDMLTTYGIELENKTGYDHVFVANMCLADYYRSSVPDEAHLMMFVKDTIDDPDAGDGVTMRRWYATMVACGEVVPWEEFL